MLCRANREGQYQEIALGQGQVDSALEATRAAAASGGWVCLKNAHLVVTWLPALDRLLREVSTSAKESFRLWITSEPHASFPAALLSSCLVRSA